MKTLLAFCLALSSCAFAQTSFQVHGDGSTGGSLSNHTADTRISTSTTSGFTSPAAVIFEHVNGKDFNISPANGVLLFGAFQFGTGSFISGSLTGPALYDVDQSYVTISSNGTCGQFNPDGTCKAGGHVPQTNILFVGVFTGTISWSTNADHTHVLNGTVSGTVNGGSTVITRNLTATTVADPNPFVSNGHLKITTVTLTP